MLRTAACPYASIENNPSYSRFTVMKRSAVARSQAGLTRV